jgi:hypothetical protein
VLTAVLAGGCSSPEAGPSLAPPSASPSETSAHHAPPVARPSPGGPRLATAVDGWSGSPAIPEKLNWPQSNQKILRIYIEHQTSPTSLVVNRFAEVDRAGIPEERGQQSFPCATGETKVADHACRVREERPGLWVVELGKRAANTLRFGVVNAEWSAGDGANPQFMTWQLP